MKRSLVFAWAIVLLGACSTKEIDIQTPVQDDVMFYATFEQPSDINTKVYANEDLLLRWTTDDRVSIFNKLTYNQEYKFTGQTGANAGGFKKVDNDEFVTGNPLSHVVSVYPYQDATSISEDEVISLTIPAEQTYAENTFGLGANTMVSVSSDNVLQYKNVGGYLMLKLFGEGVSVSSITLKGNNGEELAGKASVTMPLDGGPSVTMSSDATTEIKLVCESPIQLGATAEESIQFWFVVPPVEFSKGFTITLRDSQNKLFEKVTTKSIEIRRNILYKMSALNVQTDPFNPSDDAIVFTDKDIKEALVAKFDTDGDGELSYAEAAAVRSGEDLKAALSDNQLCSSFDEFQYFTGITSIPDSMFRSWFELSSITIPESVTSIGELAFKSCLSLTSIIVPESVKSIGAMAFGSCSRLKSINIPERITIIDIATFNGCSSLNSITIPNNVKRIRGSAFASCVSLSSVVIPESVTLIDYSAFDGCKSLTSISVLPLTPPQGNSDMFYDTNNAPIYVPAESVEAYKTAQYWNDYADRIQPIPSAPVPEAIDLGLPSGLKWASFNLGATMPEEYGDYFAWGETEPKEDYSWESYLLSEGSYNSLQKYNFKNSYGVVDGIYTLDNEDDAAHTSLGANWRMPTIDEFRELQEECDWTWTNNNGINGFLVKSKDTDNCIFLPAAGYKENDSAPTLGYFADYWTASLHNVDPSCAWCFVFSSGSIASNSCNRRYYGYPIRPVYAE